MFIEQPPFFYRMFFPFAFWRGNRKERSIYLTFDDGPIPEVTPWVLDLLDKYGVKATFFCVGDNVRKYPEVFAEVLRRGHHVGNHTFNHLQGWKVRTKTFIANTEKADQLIQRKLFRPPHGHIRIRQYRKLCRSYKLVMWDVVTRDYSKFITPEQVFENVKRYTRNGSVIVFHDSLKSEKNLRKALPWALEWLIKEGYAFKLLEEK